MKLSPRAFTSILALLHISCGVVKAEPPCPLTPNLQKVYDRNFTDFTALYCLGNPFINPFLEFVIEQAIAIDPIDYLASTCLPQVYSNFLTSVPPPLGVGTFDSGCPPTQFHDLGTEVYPMMKIIRDDESETNFSFWFVADFENPWCADLTICSEDILNEFLAAVVLEANAFLGGVGLDEWTLVDHVTPTRQCLKSLTESVDTDWSTPCNNTWMVDVETVSFGVVESVVEMEVCTDGCTPETISEEDVFMMIASLVQGDASCVDEGVPNEIIITLPNDSDVKVTRQVASAAPTASPTASPTVTPTVTPTVKPTTIPATPIPSKTTAKGKKGKKDKPRKAPKTKRPN